MGYAHGVRKGDFIPFIQGTTQSLDIPRDRIIKAIDLNFVASAVCASTTNGAVLANGVLRIIDNIKVIGNGAVVLRDFDLESLYRYNAYVSRVIPFYLEPTAATDATYVIGFTVRIPFDNELGQIPEDTSLNATLFQSLILKIQWAPTVRGALFTATRAGGADTIASTFGITPFIYESVYPGNPQAMRYVTSQDLVVAATSTSLQKTMNVYPKSLYQMIWFKTTDANVPESDIINSFTLKTGGRVEHVAGMDFVYLQKRNQIDVGLTAIPAGFAFLHLTERGKVGTGLLTADVNTAILDFNVTVGTGATNIRIITDIIEPVA